MEMNQQVLLKSRPFGEPTEECFDIVQTPLPQLSEGQVLTRTIYLSLDPYMRGRMSALRSYAQPVEIGQVMVGGTVGQVVESKNAAFQSGDFVLGYSGWQKYGVSNGSDLTKLDPSGLPISYYLGVLGMPGLTAYAGLLEVGRPQPGQTVVVSSAAGAVGSVVGQIAKLKGCRAIGCAGSQAKADYVTKELGLDECINYDKQPLLRTLKRTCPDGVHVYYDNVAGVFLEAVMQHLAMNARIVLVGLISQYNDTAAPPGPNLAPLLVTRSSITGFLVNDWEHRRDEFLRDMTGWLKEGKVKYREDIVDGLPSAPKAFIGLFHGKNFGKLVVKVSDDPTR